MGLRPTFFVLPLIRWIVRAGGGVIVMDLPNRVEKLIAPTVDALGFDIVRVQFTGKGRLTLQIMAEPKSGTVMTVDDCASISRAVSAVLDVADSIPDAYTLEVSSPGIDRPLVRLEDFDRFSGLEAKVEMAQPIDGHRRFRGQLMGIDGDNVRLAVDGAEVNLPYKNILRAKLIMNDALLAPLVEQ